ncbi:MAG: hypothetical protein FJY75_12045 [Candidatus Eisenbacteria bacterium]|uniref:Uncharacterized protein n=2 Tax=Eiseniibacteriota bacterium TaxID=2212470 RepID=A0A938BPQ1_UNCEI|nr:hypothetical protein [Candidatus Eisenbacteria bacterium]
MDRSDNDAPRARGAPPPCPQPRRVLRTGTYLHTSCPLCRAEIVEGDWIHFRAIAPDGALGDLRLSARFNVFDQESTIALGAGDQVRDLACPRCGVSLLDAKLRCAQCGAAAVRIRVAAVRTELDLLLCSRYGCHWHDVPEEDRQRLVLEQGP